MQYSVGRLLRCHRLSIVVMEVFMYFRSGNVLVVVDMLDLLRNDDYDSVVPGTNAYKLRRDIPVRDILLLTCT